MPWKVLAGLVLCNLIWSAHPVMGKVLLADVSPVLAAWLRYSSALAAYLVASVLLRAAPSARRKLSGPFFLLPRTVSDCLLVAGVGVLGFCFAPLLQLTGLNASRATDNALIVAMEPLLTVALAWAVLRERLSFGYVLVFGAAFAGFCLLSGLNGLHAGSLSDLLLHPSAVPGRAHLMGNLLMLLALVGEASYSVLGRKLVGQPSRDGDATRYYEPLGVFGSALLIGVVFLTIATLLAGGPGAFAGVAALGWKGLLALFWLGPLGTAFAYFYWMLVLRQAPVASLVLTLFIQPVFGSIWGLIFLGERLSGVQSVGALLIVGALAGQSAVARLQAAWSPVAVVD